MVIPRDVQRKWAHFKQRGDVNKLARLCRKSRVVVSSALNGNTCSREVYSVISKYYNDIEHKMDSLNLVTEDSN